MKSLLINLTTSLYLRWLRLKWLLSWLHLNWLSLYIWNITSLYFLLSRKRTNVFMHIWSWLPRIIYIMNKMTSCTMTTTNWWMEVSTRNSSVIRRFVHLFLYLLFSHLLINKLILILWILLFLYFKLFP